MRFFTNLLFFVSVLAPTILFAQSSSFPIRIAPNDITPPTAPVLVSATPVGQSQIDIDWSASTDNFIVIGYVVYRDTVAVATTTLTNYSDSSLAASTTYSYYVRAFDASYNYSSDSNILATTTYAVYVPPVDQKKQIEGTVARTVLDDLKIVENYTSTQFTISTRRPARIDLRWGRTTSYELGYVSNSLFLSEYQTTITDLEPGTTYEYEVIGYTPQGIETLLKRGQFTTLEKSVNVMTPNVNRFTAVGVQNDVRLVWELPTSIDIDYVRIVRSHLGYPTYLQGGSIVYQGLGTSIVDENILDTYSPVYYTAFVVDKQGNVSSGAVTKVYALNNPTGSVPEDDTDSLDVTPIKIIDKNATTEDVSTTATSTNFRIPDLSEIFIIQDNYRYTFAYETVLLVSDAPFTISIPREAVATSLKTIIATIVDPTDTRQQYSFLLKINRDQSAYEATISPLAVYGSSWILVDIYDYESKVVSSYRKKVTFQGEGNTGKILFPDIFIENMEITIGAIVLSLMSLFLLLYRRRADEDNR